MEQLTVQGNGVYIGPGALLRAGGLLRQHVPAVSRWAVAADESVAALYGDAALSALHSAGLAAELYLLPAGERAKTPEVWLSLCRRLVSDGFHRGGGIVSLGGGTCGDMAGFAASTLLRGVALAHLPTTLLAQTDSAIGGKTGLDLPEGKNLLGTFCPPALVVSDTACLATLPPRQFASGIAEVIKYGCITDASLLDAAERGISADDGPALAALVARCCRSKAELVAQDPYDRGLRHLLNFGHTFGHAYEALGGFETYTHGEAVAAGMIRVLRWQLAHGYGGEALLDRLTRLLPRYGLPLDIPCDETALRRWLTRDKKAEGDQVTLALAEKAGQGRLVTVPLASLWEDTP